jgi:hypothetical protein
MARANKTKPTKEVIPYLLEPILNSELILVNNAKKLKENPELLNEEHLQEIEELRQKFIELDRRSNDEKGLQKEMRQVRDQLRDLSYQTYTDRDTELFGRMITKIAQGIVSRPQFSNYTFKDEMMSLGIQYVLLYSGKFDPYKTSKYTGQLVSAFAYISTIIFSGCIATINKFKNEQLKAKEDFLETQKLIHRDPNQSTYGPEFENANRKIKLPTLQPGELYKKFHEITINEATEFWIPTDYKITQKEIDFVEKYIHNISIRRIK